MVDGYLLGVCAVVVVLVCALMVRVFGFITDEDER